MYAYYHMFKLKVSKSKLGYMFFCLDFVLWQAVMFVSADISKFIEAIY